MPKVSLTGRDVLSVILQTLKLLSNFIYLSLFLLGMMGIGTGMGYFVSQIESVKVPSQSELTKQVTQLSRLSTMSYANGDLISEIDADLIRTPVESSAISENIKKAIVATEDETFQEHQGVLPKAVFRAFLTSVGGLGATSGGSTLTQQLLKQQLLGDAPTFKRKAQEIMYALELERGLSKDEILTAYLNVSPFGRNNKGQNIAGIEEAAQGIFGVSAKDLTMPQAAFIAGLPQSPIVYSPYQSDGSLKDKADYQIGIDRQQDVLYSLYRSGMINKSEYDEYMAYDIAKDFQKTEKAETAKHDYLYYTVLDEAQDRMYDYLIERDEVSEQELKNDETQAAYRQRALEELESGGYRITSTINKAVYNAMQNAVSTYGHLLDANNGSGIETGNVLMDNKTGAILGFIGGRDYETNQNNHAFDTKRSPGSSIKPILAYGIAIDQGLMGSASILSNYPTTYSSGQEILHDGDKGTAMMNLQDALNTSWNIPAFWTYQMLQNNGVDVQSYMEKMGYEIPDYNIESLPLGGGIDVSVQQQVNAYQMLANNGVYHQGHVIDKITDSDGKVIYEYENKGERVFSAATATISQELLKGPISSGQTTTFKSALSSANGALSGADWIGKTGTTDNFGDVWLIVSTPSATLGGWAGYDNNASLHQYTGYQNNSQFMANLASEIAKADPSVFNTSQRFTLDDSVIRAEVLKSTGLVQGAAVNVNGRQITLNGEKTTSYWAKNGPGAMTYRFAIGGTDSDYQKAWASLAGGGSSSNNRSSNNSSNNNN